MSRVAVSDDGQRLYSATGNGFGIFSARPFVRLTTAHFDGTVAICVPLPSRPTLLAIVGGADRPAVSCRSVTILDWSRPPSFTPVATLRAPSRILNVLASPVVVAAVTVERVFIYSAITWELMFEVKTPPNPAGLAALSPNESAPYLAVPSSDTSARILVVDVAKHETVREFQAHRGQLRCCSVSPCGLYVATASASGTLVRVFRLPGGEPVQTLRRGLTPASISSLHFFALPSRCPVAVGPSDEAAPASVAVHRPDDTRKDGGARPPSFLAVGSDSSAVQIFRLACGPAVAPYFVLDRARGGAVCALWPPTPAAASAPPPPELSFTGRIASMALQAVSGEGDREFATVLLRNAVESNAAMPAVGAAPEPGSILFSSSQAADPAIAVSIAIAFYDLPSSPVAADPGGGSGGERPETGAESCGGGEPAVSPGVAADDAEWEGSDGEQLQWTRQPPGCPSPAPPAAWPEEADMSASWMSLPVDPLPPSPQPPPASSRAPPRGAASSAFEAVHEGVARGRLPPPYVVTVHTRSGLALQYSLDPVRGGVCELVGEFSADLVVVGGAAPLPGARS